jgi:3-deoxy-manno-octulosonate cytidylyltransferase (CMP-KDO synthetase)
MTPLIVIPARMGSVRLPHKPLALIQGIPMILQVWRQACKAQLGPVVVACDHEDIAHIIQAEGGNVVLTEGQHPTGSDRAFEAAQRWDPEGYHDIVFNLQGDLPVFPSQVLAKLIPPFARKETDLVTLMQPAKGFEDSVGSVQVLVDPFPESYGFICRNFTRKKENAVYQHVGIYAFRRASLARFAALPQTEHERAESLEQLRALDHNMSVVSVLLEGEETFMSVDTAQDLEAVCHYFERLS